MYRVYHKTQGINWFKSCFMLLDGRFMARRNIRMLENYSNSKNSYNLN